MGHLLLLGKVMKSKKSVLIVIMTSLKHLHKPKRLITSWLLVFEYKAFNGRETIKMLDVWVPGVRDMKPTD